ncbi:hypothetical protein HanIR_Chr02g0062651 [Helianthus annuus]|nr:hypothetical protein HanIR_Chr02g0062651 [Helianthus annuus]
MVEDGFHSLLIVFHSLQFLLVMLVGWGGNNRSTLTAGIIAYLKY